LHRHHDRQTSPGSGRAAGQDHQPKRTQPARRRGRSVPVTVVAQGPVVQLPAPAGRRRWRPTAAIQRRRVPVHGEPTGHASRRRAAVRSRTGDRTVHNHTEGHHKARPDGLNAHVQRTAAAHGTRGARRVRPGRRAPATKPERAGQAALLGRLHRRDGRMLGHAARVRRQLALFALRQHHSRSFGRLYGQRRCTQVRDILN